MVMIEPDQGAAGVERDVGGLPAEPRPEPFLDATATAGEPSAAATGPGSPEALGPGPGEAEGTVGPAGEDTAQGMAQTGAPASGLDEGDTAVALVAGALAPELAADPTTPAAPETAPSGERARRDRGAAPETPAAPLGPAETAARLLRGMPRAVQQAQVAGFLVVARAHPTRAAALDYAGRKREQAERSDQRVEAQLWTRVGQALPDLPPGGAGRPAEARLVQTFAQGLAAENLWRLAQVEEAARWPARRGPAERPPARTGGERG